MVERSTLRLFEILGRGSQGVVRRARLCHPAGPQREVAIKHLLPAEDVDLARRAIARLRDEASALAALNHPAIPDFVDLFVVEGSLAMATRYVDGFDLGALLDEGRVLPPRAAAEWLAVTADALASGWQTPGPDGEALHLIHRDIKPSNLRLDRRGRPWLLDFGLARGRTLRRLAETEVAGVVGSPGYLSPQRWQGVDAERADDVFALGLIAIEMLGAPPAVPPLERARTCPEAFRSAEAWAERRRARLAELEDAPHDLRSLCARMLAWEPSDRPSAAEVQARMSAMMPTLAGPDLRGWASQLPPPSPPSDQAVREVVPVPLGSDGRPIDPRSAPPRRRVAAAGWVMGGIVLLAWGGSVWLSVGDDRPSPSPVGAAGELGSVDPEEGSSTGERGAAQKGPEVEVTDGGPTPPPPRPPAPAPERTAAPRDPVGSAYPARPRVVSPSPAPASSASIVAPRAVVDDASEASGEERVALTWRAEGPVPVRLRREGVRMGPGEVEAGAWQVEADFGRGYVPAGEVTMSGEGEVVIRCMPWLGLCERVR